MTIHLTDTLAADFPSGTLAVPPAIDARLRGLVDRFVAAAPTNLGFPAATDIDYTLLAPLLEHLFHSIANPQTDSLYPGHVHDLERETLAFFAQLFRAPSGWSGYVTGGGSEGNLYGLWLARTRLPDAVVYHSAAAHYSVPKACHLLGVPTVEVAATPAGEIDYADLHRHATRARNRPGIVVANIGTTMTEAVDDVARIHAALDAAGITGRYVHSDAALAGVPLVSAPERPAFDLADGADSISISGHKFFGTPVVCGVVLARRGPGSPGSPGTHVPYIGGRDTTISGSRSGLATAMLWYATQLLGAPGHAARATRARDLARYTVRQLESIGWPTWRNPHSMTVMLARLPVNVASVWPLPSDGRWSHLICVPGRTKAQIDRLVNRLGEQPRGAFPTVDG